MSAKTKISRSKVLTGIAVFASGVALAISITATAQANQMPGNVEPQHSFHKRSQMLQMNIDLLKRAPDSFPLMLPQPTKIEQQNKYAIG
jgi:hypothetical protein